MSIAFSNLCITIIILLCLGGCLRCERQDRLMECILDKKIARDVCLEIYRGVPRAIPLPPKAP
jgi:hypothetical protein